MLTFLFKNLLIFTQNFSLSNVEKIFFLSSLFLKKIYQKNLVKKIYQIFQIWKKFMHENAIKIVGGVKFSKKIPQNVGFFDQKVWDFWHWGGDKIVGFSASRGGFSPFNFWPHCDLPKSAHVKKWSKSSTWKIEYNLLIVIHKNGKNCYNIYEPLGIHYIFSIHWFS